MVLKELILQNTKIPCFTRQYHIHTLRVTGYRNHCPPSGFWFATSNITGTLYKKIYKNCARNGGWGKSFWRPGGYL